MKREQRQTKLLGISQGELAGLLGVSRSLFSMYQINQRDLPSKAGVLLHEMIAHVLAPATTSKENRAEEQQAVLQQLEHLLHENEYRQRLQARKTVAMTKKQKTEIRFHKLAEFFENKKMVVDLSPKGCEGRISAARTAAKEHAVTIAMHQHRQDLLDLEKKLLESKLRELRKGNE